MWPPIAWVRPPKQTGQPIDKIERETERDRFLSAVEAVEYGVVDEVLEELPSDGKKKGK